uniref:Uncharacterized protein n=1 Tax=Lepeophtheirus salmonis TaxID=72036 RepID=A0A0K2TH89_LEPSM
MLYHVGNFLDLINIFFYILRYSSYYKNVTTNQFSWVYNIN